MKHYDQHTIDLYVLGSERIAAQRDEIEKHLKECYTCRSIAEELSQFYQMVGGNQTLLEGHTEEEEEDSLVLRPEFGQRGGRAHLQPVPRSIPVRAWGFASRRPFVTSVGVLAVLAVLLFALRGKGEKGIPNVADAIINESLGALVAYDKDGAILWQIPESSAKILMHEEQSRRVRYTQVADLNRDGYNEVITTLPLPKDDARHWVLRVFDGQKNLKLEKAFTDRLVTFRSVRYEADFSLDIPLVIDAPSRQEKELLVTGSNGRSPFFVSRLDIRGNALGRYWHFGSLGISYLVTLDGDTSKKMILTGVNDIEAIGTCNAGVIVVLDPSKIEGETESTLTRGFGLSPSNAELLYIQLPRSDIDAVRGSCPGNTVLESEGENVLRFTTTSNAPDQLPDFEYIFDRELKILDVKVGTVTERLHASLRNEGKITSTLGKAYLEDLKRRVKYWNGKEWVNEYSKVNSR